MRLRVVGAVLLVGLAGCVGPARSFEAYEGKAGATADAAHSAVETARLAAETAAADDAFAPYLSVLISETEEDASSVQGTFDSIQPPDDRSDKLREQLDALLSRAVSGLADLRVAVKRGELQDLERLAAPLAEVSKGLDAFAEAHA